jgi:hypothetical protein
MGGGIQEKGKSKDNAPTGSGYSPTVRAQRFAEKREDF